mmetsp:Transcript_46174/g.108355  ORF Transcript_46174/g.108355 Transcript_46174/m.108355 type:complete len:262 (-) Transcript_46174:683-1468(-)
MSFGHCSSRYTSILLNSHIASSSGNSACPFRGCAPEKTAPGAAMLSTTLPSSSSNCEASPASYAYASASFTTDAIPRPFLSASAPTSRSRALWSRPITRSDRSAEPRCSVTLSPLSAAASAACKLAALTIAAGIWSFASLQASGAEQPMRPRSASSGEEMSTARAPWADAAETFWKKEQVPRLITAILSLTSILGGRESHASLPHTASSAVMPFSSSSATSCTDGSQSRAWTQSRCFSFSVPSSPHDAEHLDSKEPHEANA